MIEEFHFIRPEWLLAVVPILGLAWFWFRRTRSGSAWQSAISKELLPVLLDVEETRSGQWLRGLILGSLTVATVGLAGPTWEKLPQNVKQKNDALVVLLDLSLSMWAEDVKPSRIVRARQKVTDILRARKEGMTALVAYAGDAHAVVPLTDDVATIENLLGALDPGMMPVLGSNPGHGLEIAKELLSNANMSEGRILVITDGIDKVSSVTSHRNRAFPISIIGIGTYEGGAIPLEPTKESRRYLLSQEGNQIIALLDERRLTEVANLSYGKYSKINLSDDDFNRVLSTPLPTEDASIEVEREFDTWFDQGHWLAALLLPLCLLGFRRGALVMLLFAFATPSMDAVAATNSADNQTAPGSLWDKLWWRDDQRAHQALTAGEPEKAAILFQDPQWRAVASYRSGDWGHALRGFDQDPSNTGTYNRGTAEARLGNYQKALDLYAKVLSETPAHEDAAFNKALIERLLQQQQQQQDEAKQEGSDNQQEQQSANSEQSQSNEEQQQSDQQSDENASDPTDEQRESEQESDSDDSEQQRQELVNRDEKREALEQWLRRVPDEPGGLLRRKFQHETKQRLRNGNYEHRQGEKVW